MTELTSEEAELYDRQIRAWGFEAQRRMRESKVLLIGLDGAGTETLKNLVLAGLGKITILEDRTIDQSIIDNHFYVTNNDINTSWCKVSQKYFSEMNPNIDITMDCNDPYSKSDEFYSKFDVIICCNQSRYLQLRIDDLCRQLYPQTHIAFFSCRSVAHCGYIFADLQTHTFKEKQIKSESKENSEKLTTLEWFPLKDTLTVPQSVINKTFKAKQNYLRHIFYSIQIIEPLESAILEKNTFFENSTLRFNKIKEIFAQLSAADIDTNDTQSEYTKILESIRTKVRESNQFQSNDWNETMVRQLLSQWHCNVNPSNAMLGGYLANFVMFFVQCKAEPLRNYLVFDMWHCNATSALFKPSSDNAPKKPIATAVVLDICDIASDSDDDADDNNDATMTNNDISTIPTLTEAAIDSVSAKVKKSVEKKQPTNVIVLDDSDDDQS